jgi:hypothetical protein
MAWQHPHEMWEAALLFVDVHMPTERSTRTMVGRVLLVAAISLLVLAMAFAAGMLPLDPASRGLIAGLLAVALTDALIGVWLLRRRP